jgi:two-component system chemotaxis response regulator CheY
VLVVDDDGELRAALSDILEDAGYVVSSARDGSDACRVLAAEAVPDLMVVDLFMPVLDGWGLIRALRADTVCATIPVIVMTAAGASVLATAPVVAGYVTKPIDVDRLLSIVRRTLSLRPPAGDGRDRRSHMPRARGIDGERREQPVDDDDGAGTG